MVACLAALPGELGGLRRRMTRVVSGAEAFTNRPGTACYTGRHGDKRILLVQTGMGREAAERAARFTFDHVPVSALISFGFAGGLSPHLQAGDLVLCERLYREGDAQGQSAVRSDASMLSAALTQRVEGRALTLGSSVTVDRLVSRPEEKQSLRETYPADVLEMESYWIGRACAERRVAFLAVRVVSDPAGQHLPPLERWIDLSGALRWPAALRNFLLHPAELAGMARLAFAARSAERRLTRFLCAFLQSWRGA